MLKIEHVLFGFVTAVSLLIPSVDAQDRVDRYFITYDHYMEEPRTLEVSTSPVIGRDNDINTFVAAWTEFEYGVTKRWTSEFYFDWQHTKHEGSLITGVRFENRYRLFLEARKINPVLYVEYEHLNGADKTLKEIVGFDSKEDLQSPNNEARHEHEREIEPKLILSSDFGEWNIAENFIGAKDLNGGPWEFGYAVAASCTFTSSQRLAAGVEVYGGLGTWHKFTFRGTSQYIAPVVSWVLPSETTLRFSPGWGLTDQSVRSLIRFGVGQEIDNIPHHLAKIFRRH
jgi:hypothetical protein